MIVRQANCLLSKLTGLFIWKVYRAAERSYMMPIFNAIPWNGMSRALHTNRMLSWTFLFFFTEVVVEHELHGFIIALLRIIHLERETQSFPLVKELKILAAYCQVCDPIDTLLPNYIVGAVDNDVLVRERSYADKHQRRWKRPNMTLRPLQAAHNIFPLSKLRQRADYSYILAENCLVVNLEVNGLLITNLNSWLERARSLKLIVENTLSVCFHNCEWLGSLYILVRQVYVNDTVREALVLVFLWRRFEFRPALHPLLRVKVNNICAHI